MFTLDAIMTTDLITVTPTASLADVRALMQEHRIHHIPVVGEHNTLVGLVTLTNVLAATDSILRNTETRIHASEASVTPVCFAEAVW